MKMKKTLIFPEPFHINNPTFEEQNDYMISSLYDEVAMEEVGTFVDVNKLEKSDYYNEIQRLIARKKPDWIIAAGESATTCLKLFEQKKILLNPSVTEADLEHVTEYAKTHTFGFFGASAEREFSYGLFQTLYPNTYWFVNVPELQLANIAEICKSIIENS